MWGVRLCPVIACTVPLLEQHAAALSLRSGYVHEKLAVGGGTACDRSACVEEGVGGDMVGRGRGEDDVLFLATDGPALMLGAGMRSVSRELRCEWLAFEISS